MVDQFTKAWWKERLLDVANTGWRAFRTGCQTALALIGTETVGVTDVDWYGIASASALSMVIYVLMTIAFGPSRDARDVTPRHRV